jgi:hypothetical protein
LGNVPSFIHQAKKLGLLARILHFEMTMKKYHFFLLFFLVNVPLGAVTPMDHFISLVAGDDDPGCKDGAFDEARFNQPCGLAFDDKGQRLFVADINNSRVRVIYLNEGHRVETLVGPGIGEIKMPRALAYLAGDKLAVYDSSDGSLRSIDLQTKTAKILNPSVGNIWNMVYRKEDNAIYMTDPFVGKFQRYGLEKGDLSTIFENSKEISRPLALCVHDGKLFISDETTSVVYQMEITAATANMTKIGTGNGILEMAFTQGDLYAFQSSSDPLVIVGAETHPVSIPSVWGFPLSNLNPSYSPLLAGTSGQPLGFAASPLEEGRIFIAMPHSRGHCVISIDDRHFGQYWSAREAKGGDRELTDFDYPEAKPSKTFRILVVGNSRIVTAPTALTESDLAAGGYNLDDRDFHSLRLDTFAKKLEFKLNAEAALNGLDERFEVLELGRPGLKLQFFINDQVPPLVKKYDIDLVLGLLSPTFEEEYDDYYLKPMNSDGIPSNKPDPEYALKPWKDRVPSGAPKQLLERAMKLELIKPASTTQLRFCMFQDLLVSGDPDLRDDLIEMLGTPLRVFYRRMEDMKIASSGLAPKVGLFFVPDPDGVSNGLYESFWTDLCSRFQFDLLDLSKPYEDLKYSYFPATEACCHQHYTAYGNELIADLLRHYLPQKGWIPVASGSSRTP